MLFPQVIHIIFVYKETYCIGSFLNCKMSLTFSFIVVWKHGNMFRLKKNNWKNVKIIFSHNYYAWSFYDILSMHDLRHEQCQMMHHKTLKFLEKWDISLDKHVSDTEHKDHDKPTYRRWIWLIYCWNVTKMKTYVSMLYSKFIGIF